MRLPDDYIERVYAGVLGKMIGVYLGRPIEGWTYDRITKQFGEIEYYVHDQVGQPLVVADDDLSGTFTFVRALADHGSDKAPTSAQIGDTWLNYIVPGRSILWWGGLGQSTEHTAYLHLQRGVRAPQSGAMSRNGNIVAEQIGAQIFIDSWAMVAPGDPELAASLAKSAAQVSHDGEAVWAAQLLAAMEAQAFCESNIERLIDTGTSFIPEDSTIARMIRDIQAWRSEEPDWRAARQRLEEHYGYHKFPGNCHVVPNHGIIILSLLYGQDDFQRTLMIANTSGWDTDCNSGNVGCLMGIKNGLAGIDQGPDWRGPMADRLYLPTADSGRAITDAVRETYAVVNMGRELHGLSPLHPKDGARFHFEAPGSVQGFRVIEPADGSAGNVSLSNVQGYSQTGTRCLAIQCRRFEPDQAVRISTATFMPTEALQAQAYRMMASPTLSSGQTVRTGLRADRANPGVLEARVFIRYFDGDDQLQVLTGPPAELSPDAYQELTWKVPDTAGCPIAEIGIELRAHVGAEARAYLDYVTWSGAPTLRLVRPPGEGRMWRRAWVDAVDHWRFKGTYQLAHDHGVGLLMYGTSDWDDYRVETKLTPLMTKSFGIAARVRGMRRHVALVVSETGTARVVTTYDQQLVELVEAPLHWQLGAEYHLALEVEGRRLSAFVNGRSVINVKMPDLCLDSGGIALVCEEGCVIGDEVIVKPISSRSADARGGAVA